jgi:hypothetical protein
MGTLVLAIDPPGARVFLNNSEYEPGSHEVPRSLQLNPGSYTIRIAMDHYSPREERVEIRQSETCTRYVKLKAIHSNSPPDGSGDSGLSAIVAQNVSLLTSPVPNNQISAAKGLESLGPKAQTGRRALCNAMLEHRHPSQDNAAVRKAAADALKAIDPKIWEFAVTLANSPPLYTAVGEPPLPTYRELQRLGDSAEPLTPLITMSVYFSQKINNAKAQAQQLTVLSSIASRDEEACGLLGTAVDDPNPELRNAALQGLARMKHGRTVVPKIISRMNPQGNETPANLIAAIHTLTALRDESNADSIMRAVHELRYHQDVNVRKAVESAVKVFQTANKP